jgi:hypothetical protein
VQRFGIVENEKEAIGQFIKERSGLLFHQALEVLTEGGERGRRGDPVIVLQACHLVEHGIDDPGKKKPRTVFVELDELPATLGRKMEVPGADHAGRSPCQAFRVVTRSKTRIKVAISARVVLEIA